MFPDGNNSGYSGQTQMYSFSVLLPVPSKPCYKELTVMLIDERAQSQAEEAGLFLRTANGTKFIGSPTAGANGMVTNLVVPGGITIRFTGIGIAHADGTQLQRVGLLPDVKVEPTIHGIQAGKDEVLEKAIEYIGKESSK
jgi:C-terminal processing protease CtpA/Prc